MAYLAVAGKHVEEKPTFRDAAYALVQNKNISFADFWKAVTKKPETPFVFRRLDNGLEISIRSNPLFDTEVI